MSQTELGELGEFGLIEKLTDSISIKNEKTILGIGDDCAIIDSTDKQTVVTTDLLLEGIHFDLTYTPMKHLGYKAVSVNLSDVYAMNATPRQITVSIGVSAKFTVEALTQFYEGIKLACDLHNVDLIGGDTTSSITGLVISITAIGEVDKNKAVKRNGAKINELICVSGDLGAAYIGLQILEREKKIFNQTKGSPKLEGYDYVLERQLKPEARKDIVEGIKQANVHPTSMIDISDGLSSELLHICKQSGVGCKVFEDRIPINQLTAEAAKEFSIEPMVCALNGGEDYELLFTIPTSEYDKVLRIKDVSVIGNITKQEEGLHLITKAGNPVALKAQGWNSLLK